MGLAKTAPTWKQFSGAGEHHRFLCRSTILPSRVAEASKSWNHVHCPGKFLPRHNISLCDRGSPNTYSSSNKIRIELQRILWLGLVFSCCCICIGCGKLACELDLYILDKPR